MGMSDRERLEKVWGATTAAIVDDGTSAELDAVRQCCQQEREIAQLKAEIIRLRDELAETRWTIPQTEDGKR